MIRAGLVFCALALPAAAQDLVDPALCEAAWARLGTLLPAEPPIAAGRVSVQEGWCVAEDVLIPVGRGEFDSANRIDRLRVRGDGLDWFVDPAVLPGRLEVEIVGLTKGYARVDTFAKYRQVVKARLEKVDASLAVSWDASARELTLERLEVDYPGDNQVSLSGRVVGVDLSSPAAMQMSMTGFAVKDAELSIITHGLFEEYGLFLLIGPSWMDGEGDVEGMVADKKAKIVAEIDQLPETFMTADSKAALAALIAELPNPAGTLTLSFRSEAGFGSARVMGYALTGVPQSVAEAAPLFQGVTVDLGWTPDDAP